MSSGNTAAAGSGTGMSATNSGKPDMGSPAGSKSMSSDSSSGAAGKSTSSGSGTGGSMMSSSGGGSGGKSTSSSGGGSGGAGSGASTSGTGGSMTSSSGGGGGGGSGGSSSSSSGMFSPLCDAVPPTAAGGAPNKGGACTDSDPQLCYKTCGPQSIGFKSETCTNGAYAEMTGCSFPDADYSCFKIPMMQDASCPTMTPQAGMACEVAACTLCAVNMMYLDSSGAAKTGYCVCPMAGASGMRKWSCASTTAWPCPTGRGC
ncbi:MAG TPA: hypothetical protein VJV78_17340 [Polyangiales bacterium]|nr:hypothetical protein [Polyangiales bacterium]